MRSLRVLVFLAAGLGLTAESPTPTPPSSETPTPSPAVTPTPSPSPSPLPTPVNAFLSLDVTAGPPSAVINVSGGQFLPNQQMNLYWDTAGHVAGAATADASGSFNTRVKPFAGDKRSEERRVGKECRARVGPCHEKQKEIYAAV